jgi:hypothetical protein
VLSTNTQLLYGNVLSTAMKPTTKTRRELDWECVVATKDLVEVG